MDFPLVLERHLTTGALHQINDSTFGVTSKKHGASATVRVLIGRATVEFAGAEHLPATVPSSPVLREQMQKYKGAFYASPHQLNSFLVEMT